MTSFLWTQVKDWCNRWSYEEFKFEPRDIWIGVFWQTDTVFKVPGKEGELEITFYICIVPMLVLIVTFR